MQFFCNQFGFDRHSSRALVLSPVDRRLILLGKNLATLPVGATFGLAELPWQMAGWPRAVPVNLFVSVAFAALAVLLYWRTIERLGRLLQRRETKILGVVTVAVE